MSTNCTCHTWWCCPPLPPASGGTRNHQCPLGTGPGGERDLREGGQGLGSQLQLPQGEGEGHPRAGPCGEETVALQSSSWHSPSLPHCRGLCTRRQTHKLKLVLETEISSGPSRRYCSACVHVPCPVPILCYLPCSKLRSSARQQRRDQRPRPAESRSCRGENRRCGPSSRASSGHEPHMIPLHTQARDAQARERAAEERGRHLEEQRCV